MRTPKIEALHRLIDWFNARSAPAEGGRWSSTLRVRRSAPAEGGRWSSTLRVRRSAPAEGGRWSSTLRVRRSNNNVKLSKLELDNSPLSSNAWLAGFIESDGNFYCGFDLNSDGIAKIVKCYMRISQKKSYRLNSEIPENQNTNLNIMEKIREFLNVKNVTEIKRVKENYLELAYEVRTTKKESCDLLINYLTEYPLFSSACAP